MAISSFQVRAKPEGWRSPAEVLSWAFERYSPSIAASSSFQTQSLPLLHMISKVCPQLPIVFIDTGFHFPETLAFRDRLVERFDLRLEIVAANDRGSKAEPLYRRDPDLCCLKNKVEPFLAARRGLAAWVSGIRRDQTKERRGVQEVEELSDGTVKVCPLALWSEVEVREYSARHDLPAHPLDGQGYASIGCQPCTLPTLDPQDPRSGRWAGQGKAECGLHVERQGRRDS